MPCPADAGQGVAPHGGAWIEMTEYAAPGATIAVAPHGGAWIEMFRPRRNARASAGRPSRRGVD